MLSPLPPAEAQALASALSLPPDLRRDAVAAVAASDPRCLQAWADLAELTTDQVERYAYARVGYHRGLDALRAAGWRGSGYVRWRHESNRGFLRSLDALRLSAAALEGDRGGEAVRALPAPARPGMGIGPRVTSLPA